MKVIALATAIACCACADQASVTEPVVRPMETNETTPFSSPPVVTPSTPGGTVTWGYRVVARIANGDSATTNEGVARGSAVLGATDYNQVSWRVAGETVAVTYDVWRVTGDAGLIGHVEAGVSTLDDIGQTPMVPGSPPLENTTDVGLAVFVADMSDTTFDVGGEFLFDDDAAGNGVTIEGSIDGVSWFPIGPPILTTGTIQYSAFLKFARTRTKGLILGGTPLVSVSGSIEAAQ